MIYKRNSKFYFMENADVAEHDKQHPMLHDLADMILILLVKLIIHVHSNRRKAAQYQH